MCQVITVRMNTFLEPQLTSSRNWDSILNHTAFCCHISSVSFNLEKLPQAPSITPIPLWAKTPLFCVVLRPNPLVFQARSPEREEVAVAPLRIFRPLPAGSPAFSAGCWGIAGASPLSYRPLLWSATWFLPGDTAGGQEGMLPPQAVHTWPLPRPHSWASMPGGPRNRPFSTCFVTVVCVPKGFLY